MLSEIHQFKLPKTIIFGWSAAERVGEQAAKLGRRALLISGRGATKASGLQGQIKGLLERAGLEVSVFDQVAPEPAATTVDAAVAAIRESRAEVVVGIGGGSPLDTAKAAAGLAPLEGCCIEYLRGREIDRPGLPFIAIPTTAGTAAEITKNAVFLDEEQAVKLAARSDFWFPKVALVDPELTLAMPPALTAACGMDALSHALESYVSRRAHPASEALSAKAITLIGGALRRAFVDGADRQVREDMMLGSMVAGMAFANVGCGAAHALGHVVGPAFGLSHGAACGLLLPYTLAFNMPACREKSRDIAQLLSGRRRAEIAPEQAVELLLELLSDVGLPRSLTELGGVEIALSSLIPGALLSGALQSNPRPLNEVSLLKILQQAFTGEPCFILQAEEP